MVALARFAACLVFSRSLCARRVELHRFTRKQGHVSLIFPVHKAFTQSQFPYSESLRLRTRDVRSAYEPPTMWSLAAHSAHTQAHTAPRPSMPDTAPAASASNASTSLVAEGNSPGWQKWGCYRDNNDQNPPISTNPGPQDSKGDGWGTYAGCVSHPYIQNCAAKCGGQMMGLQWPPCYEVCIRWEIVGKTLTSAGTWQCAQMSWWLCPSRQSWQYGPRWCFCSADATHTCRTDQSTCAAPIARYAMLCYAMLRYATL